MNFSQKLGLFILILITIAYIYISFFDKDFDFKFPQRTPSHNDNIEFNPVENVNLSEEETQEFEPVDVRNKEIKIFILDKNGNLRSVNRTCNLSKEKSCFAYSIKELLNAPSKWEKSKGFTSEIPVGTKLLSIRESSGNVLIDFSSDFETGGGAESTFMRIKQVIKTSKANTNAPVYLYINGKQASVIGGEGVMLKQPLNEDSLDE